MKVFQFWKKYLMSFYILISSHHFILDILFKMFAKNKFLYSIKNNSPYGIKKQKNTSTWDTEVTPNNVLDYIYKGEAQIRQEELDRFLGIAQRLKLEGLIGGNEQEDPDEDSFLEEKIITQSQKNFQKKIATRGCLG